jgi:membrane fusion protein (multidrug efflux system)
MRPGQPVKVTLDTFGRREFGAHLDSVAGASGARFALLPPDNATGNFVKVVQRVPVLVRLDSLPSDVTLRPGMSADVTVDTRNR